MVCIKCNSQVEDGVKFCPVCGANLVEGVNNANFDAQSNFNSMSSDKVNVLLVIISIFIPLVGFILFFAYPISVSNDRFDNRDGSPRRDILFQIS